MLLEHREEHIEHIVTIHFHPNCPQPNITKTIFYALAGLVLTRQNHFLNNSLVVWDMRVFTLFPKYG